MDTSKRNNFDVLRLLLASMVVFSHSYPLAQGDEKAEPLAMLTQGRLTLGTLAVDCFFVVSGYLISMSWVARPHVGTFLNKRIRRIYPGFVVAATVSAFLIAPAFSANGFHVMTRPFLLEFAQKTIRLLFFQPEGAFRSNPAPGTVNGSLWSISYEFWCYVFLMALGVSRIVQRRAFLVTLFIAALGISLWFEVLNLTPGGKLLGVVFGYPPLWARLLPYFVSGMVFFAFRPLIRFSGRGASVALLSLVLASQIPHVTPLVFPLAVGYLLFWLAYLPFQNSNRVTQYGDLSYGLYLYAFPVEQMIASVMAPFMSPLVLFVTAMPVSLGFAFLSWHCVEKHFVFRQPSLRPAATLPEGRSA